MTLIFVSNIYSQETQLSGLFFSSHEVNLDKRTSLNLTPTNPYEFPKGFSIEFDASFRPGDGYYGYIFRIIGDNKENIDLVANTASRTSNFWLVVKDQILISYKWSDILGQSFNKWMKIRLDVDVQNEMLVITINGIRREKKISEISGIRLFSVVFGACKSVSFQSTDVCPMSLKEVRLYNQKDQLFRYWKLAKHDEGTVYDEVSKAEATVENPIWIIDRHVRWTHLQDLRVNKLLGVANDQEHSRLFFVNDKAVYILNVETLTLDTISIEGGGPFNNMLAKQIIYNKYRDELWSYDFSNNNISRFNFRTKKWSYNDGRAIDSDFAHQNGIISPVDSSLVTILGYGHYTYKAWVNHYNSSLHHWVKIDRNDQIEPRYLSGAGLINDHEMIVFGGYGSKSGRQELSPGYYYDLYSFNLIDFTFKKIWTLPTPSASFVPCESLIYNSQVNCFYTLIYDKGHFKTSLRLARFDLDKPVCQLYNDSIPYDFLDTESGSMAMTNSDKSAIIAVTYHNADISVNSIAYPPLLKEDVRQSTPDARIAGLEKYLIAIIFVFFGTGVYYIWRRQKRKLQHFSSDKLLEHHGIDPIPINERSKMSAIYFMGGLQIFNDKGNDITPALSPTLKQLFLYIFLHSVKNGKGVLSSRLDEVLWFDKTGESARNNRNVNISKLRSIVEVINGLEIINDNSYWKVKLDNSIFCDYTTVLTLLKKTKSDSLGEAEIHKLINILSFGEFLTNIHYEWFDAFKAEFANEIIDGLSALFKEEVVVNSLSLKFHIAECILVYDPLNDGAFIVKCSVLYQNGKKGIAKKLYDLYCREYKQMLDVDCPISFNDVIKA